MPRPEFTYEPLEPLALGDALLVIAFPAPGFVSQVAARHLVKSQDLPLVGAFRASALPPAVSVEGGLPQPAIRVHARELACGFDGQCERLAVLVGDTVIPEPIQAAFARSVLDWSRDEGIASIILLEGMPEGAQGEREPRLSGATAFPECLEHLRKSDISLLDGVLVSGVTAAFLDEARPGDVPTLGLFVEAHNNFQDAAAAAVLVEAVDKLLLNVPLDAAPLRERAEQLTRELRRSATRSQGQLTSLPMYG